MIRPFTLICMASAFGAGLYLYQSKHTAQMLDREIARTIKQTDATRDRTSMLKAEWALLNEPDRLAELARAHLVLQTLKPTQFVAMTDLASRLPGPVAPHPERQAVEAEPEEPVVAPVAAAPVAAPVVVAAVAPKPKIDAKPEAKTEPRLAEAKAPARVVEKAQVEKSGAHAEPTRMAETVAAPVHARVFVPPPPVVASADATAPGTVGAAVLRAMRAQERSGEAPMSAAPVRAYSPPAYSPPAYTPPAYTPPAYVAPGYGAGANSVLGGHPALPPPVPFAAR